MAIQYTATDFLNKLYQNNYSYTNAYRKKVCEPNKDVETLQVDAAGVKKTVKDLGKFKGLSFNSGLDKIKVYYKATAVESKGSKTRLEKQFKNLAKTYNAMNKDAEKISDPELEKQMDKLEKLFDKNEKDLKKIGLKKKDGKYVFDSEVFADADGKVLNRLLEGKDSFVKQADKIMRNIETRLEDLQYSTVERNLMRTTKYDEDEITLASTFTLAMETTKILGKCGELLEIGALPDEYKEEIKEDFGLFTNYVYNDKNHYENEDYNKLKALWEDEETKLIKIGITFEEGADSKKTMIYDETVNFDDPDFQSAYISLFGKDSEFVKNIVDCCNDGFNDIIKPENIGVSIIDTYA